MRTSGPHSDDSRKVAAPMSTASIAIVVVVPPKVSAQRSGTALVNCSASSNRLRSIAAVPNGVGSSRPTGRSVKWQSAMSEAAGCRGSAGVAARCSLQR